VLTVRTRKIASERAQDWVQVEVQDTGKGIEADDIEHIFDPFFTTKHLSQEHEGTGLGLAIAHQIIQEHRGRIEVQSVKGKGTIFFVNLPSYHPKSPPTASPTPIVSKKPEQG
jgi:signal transduction histidine kinase